MVRFVCPLGVPWTGVDFSSIDFRLQVVSALPWHAFWRLFQRCRWTGTFLSLAMLLLWKRSKEADWRKRWWRIVHCRHACMKQTPSAGKSAVLENAWLGVDFAGCFQPNDSHFSVELALELRRGIPWTFTHIWLGMRFCAPESANRSSMRCCPATSWTEEEMVLLSSDVGSHVGLGTHRRWPGWKFQWTRRSRIVVHVGIRKGHQFLWMPYKT